jgi:hypothetical protein
MAFPRNALETVLCHAAGTATGLSALYSPRTYRNALLPTAMIWFALAFLGSGHMRMRSIPGLDYVFAMFQILAILKAPAVLNELEQFKAKQGSTLDVKTIYKICYNPRDIPIMPRVEANGENNKVQCSRLRFFLCRARRALWIIVLGWIVGAIGTAIMRRCSPDDFALEKQFVVRRMLKHRGGGLSQWEVVVRTYVSLAWIFWTFAYLELFHICLSTLFVVLLQIDEPCEWPGLYGAIEEAYTVQRFWGKFWHRLTSPAALGWARQAAGLAPGILMRRRVVRNVFISGFVFSMAGFSHALIGWRLREPELGRYVWFYLANFAAICLEHCAYSTVRSVSLLLHHYMPGSWIWRSVNWVAGGNGGWAVFGKCLGFVSVGLFFFWAAPEMEYPVLNRAGQVNV